MWEIVSDGNLFVERLRLSNLGWLVHSMDKSNNLFSSCFIPDVNGEWKIKENK